MTGDRSLGEVIREILGTLRQPRLLPSLGQPRLSFRLFRSVLFTLRGFLYSRGWPPPNQIASSNEVSATSNPLKSYVEAYKEGRGIWKWNHYFDIYHRHFNKFVGRPVHVLEIGVYSGGTLKMWRDYFGVNCRVYGVDIENACKVYENDWTKIFVGDQADRDFWKRFKSENPIIDIVIDDGGHQPEQQIVTLEEMLPHIRPGGIYLCEDIIDDLNQFDSYVHGLASHLNAFKVKGYGSITAPFQSAIHSIHSYPFVTVIEKTDSPIDQFTDPKRGSEWAPFNPGAKSMQDGVSVPIYDQGKQLSR